MFAQPNAAPPSLHLQRPPYALDVLLCLVLCIRCLTTEMWLVVPGLVLLPQLLLPRLLPLDARLPPQLPLLPPPLLPVQALVLVCPPCTLACSLWCGSFPRSPSAATHTPRRALPSPPTPVSVVVLHTDVLKPLCPALPLRDLQVLQSQRRLCLPEPPHL